MLKRIVGFVFVDTLQMVRRKVR